MCWQYFFFVVWRSAVFSRCWQILGHHWEIQSGKVLHSTNRHQGSHEIWRLVCHQVSSIVTKKGAIISCSPFRENNVHVKYPCLLALHVSMRGYRWAFYSLSVNRVNTLKFYNWNFWNNFKKASSLLHFKTIKSFPGLVLKPFYLEGVEPFPFFFLQAKNILYTCIGKHVWSDCIWIES